MKTTIRYVQRLPIFRLTIGNTTIVAIIWIIPWTDRMPPIVFVDSSKPPVNLNGSCGAVSDFGILSKTGRSCSAEIV